MGRLEEKTLKKQTQWLETDIIGYIKKKIKKKTFYQQIIAIGDDSFAYKTHGRHTHLITTDAMIEGIHWRPHWCSPEELAAKLVAVNVSDIAAMGGQPERAYLTLGIPAKYKSGTIYQFIDGLIEHLKKFQIDLCGGDTTASPSALMLSLTLQGRALPSAIMTRNTAKPGDLILITGDLGAAAAGRLALSKPKFQSDWRTGLINRFLLPIPRLEESRLLVKTKKVHALMDCSDGLAGDIRRLTAASGVGAVIYAANLPVAVNTRMAAQRFKQNVLSWVLSGGEDYELLFTCAPDNAGLLIEQFNKVSETPCAIIGEITSKTQGVSLITAEGYKQTMPKGFEHGY